MISKGTQYLTAAGFGNIRVTAASMGPLDILWTLHWLKAAAQHAILAAFGADGAAVINATSAYLSVLAATDKSKAQALAGFINEDPMMVCSLGLQPQGVTMPIRWLVGDGDSYIRTGVFASENTDVYVAFKMQRTDNTKTGVFCVDTSANNNAFGIGRWSGNMSCWYGNGGISLGLKAKKDIPYYYRQNKGHIVVEDGDGAKVDITRSLSGSIYHGEFAFPCTSRSGTFYIGSQDVSKITFYNENVNLIPFKSATREGMVDLVAGVFHPNQGTGHFTDAFTLQDGVTPWTPSTP